MYLYLSMWCIASFASVLPIRFEKKLRLFFVITVSIFYVFIIGLRYQVGGDWDPYFYMVQDATSLDDALSRTEPAYGFLNFLANKYGLGVIFVNLACAIVFVYGLIKFCFAQPLPWLALSISIPYLMIVVGMGYTRQSVAIGFVMLAYLAFLEKEMVKFSVLVVFASFFHKTAIVFLLFLFLSKRFLSSKFRLFLVSFLVVPVLYVVALSFFEIQINGYVAEAMNSDGGFIRSLMNFIPGILLLALGSKFYKKWGDECLFYKKIAFLSIVAVALVEIAPTAVDRFSLYFIPLQIFVLSRVPLIFNDEWRAVWLLCINVFYGFFLWYWLANSYYAQFFWMPYNNYIFKSLTFLW